MFDWDHALHRLAELNSLAEDPALWENQESAQKILKERTSLDTRISLVKTLQAELDDNFGLIKLGEMEGDKDIVAEAEKNIFTLKSEVARRGLANLLSGELDANDAYLQVNAGAGGTEACDWAGMIFRMYMRWAEEKGYRIFLMDKQDGEVAGIK
ncbi:MAG: PCRF domain-containing protein, partial [Alphaproteobacteria bacterium]|nr:PCRF domain-containing protein [Alphaproteobacteria bacterium]